jgi:hypothetical protein
MKFFCPSKFGECNGKGFKSLCGIDRPTSFCQHINQRKSKINFNMNLFKTQLEYFKHQNVDIN